jgi:hypothetical protein
MALDRSDFVLALGGHGYDYGPNRLHAQAANGTPTKTRVDGDHATELSLGPVLEVQDASIDVWGGSDFSIILVGELVALFSGSLAWARNGGTETEAWGIAFPSGRPSYTIRTDSGVVGLSAPAERLCAAGERYVVALTVDASAGEAVGLHGDETISGADDLVETEISFLGTINSTDRLVISGRWSGSYSSLGNVRHIAAAIVPRIVTRDEVFGFARLAAGTGGTRFRGPAFNTYAKAPRVAPASDRRVGANLEAAREVIAEGRVAHRRIECIGGESTPTSGSWSPTGAAPYVLDLFRHFLGRAVGLSGAPMLRPNTAGHVASTVDTRKFPFSNLRASSGSWSFHDNNQGAFPEAALASRVSGSLNLGGVYNGGNKPTSATNLGFGVYGAADDRDVDPEVFEGDPRFPIDSPWSFFRPGIGELVVLSAEIIASAVPGGYSIFAGDDGESLSTGSGEWVEALAVGAPGNNLATIGAVDANGENGEPEVKITRATFPEGNRTRFAIMPELAKGGTTVLGIAVLPPDGTPGLAVGGFQAFGGYTSDELDFPSCRELRKRWLSAITPDLLIGEFRGINDAPTMGPDETVGRWIGETERQLADAGNPPLLVIGSPINATTQTADKVDVQERQVDEIQEWALDEGHGLIRLDRLLEDSDLDTVHLGAEAKARFGAYVLANLAPFAWRFSLANRVASRGLGGL